VTTLGAGIEVQPICAESHISIRLEAGVELAALVRQAMIQLRSIIEVLPDAGATGPHETLPPSTDQS